MSLNGCNSVKDFLIREVERLGRIEGLLPFAQRNGLDYSHLHRVVHRAEREQLIIIERDKDTQGRPLIIYTNGRGK